jgi:hypothetical protein
MANEEVKLQPEAPDIEKQMVFPSRKSFRKMILPVVGEKIGQRWKVIYAHGTKLRFTATGPDIPQPSQHISIDGKVFMVDYVDEVRQRFNAQFVGFEKTGEPMESPRDDNVAKIID